MFNLKLSNQINYINAPADIKKGETIIVSLASPVSAATYKMVVNKITKTSKGRKAHLTYYDTKKRGGFAIMLDKMPNFMSIKRSQENGRV